MTDIYFIISLNVQLAHPKEQDLIDQDKPSELPQPPSPVNKLLRCNYLAINTSLKLG